MADRIPLDGDDMTGPQPLRRQRSPWQRWPEQDHTIEGVPVAVWRRNVNDGALVAFVGDEPEGWHLSISFRDRRGGWSRYPSWDELAHARYELLPAELDFVMHLPPPDEYVAVHSTTFHLHQWPERDASQGAKR